MTLIVPDTREVDILTEYLTPNLSMKLYSNNYTPVAGSSEINFVEVVGGGYTFKPLLFANWGITAGTPTVALYDTVQEWVFTGPLTAPATIYGYYIVETISGILKWAERFPSSVVPFVPIAGSIIRIAPRITAESA